jgi:transcriptional regulator with XRE-family HTH domain
VIGQKGCRAIGADVVRLLREERERRNMSMYLVATRSGLSPQMVSYVERGLRCPSFETVLRMADAIEVDLTELIKQASKQVSSKAR